MPAVSRHIVDRARTGHGCTFSIGVKASQFSVFANSIAVLRRGDRLLPHFIRRGFYCVFHRATVRGASPNVFVGGVPVARRGDSADFGRMVQGSRNVFVNGAG